MTTPLALAEFLAALRAETQVKAGFELEPRTRLVERGFEDVLVDLADSKLAGDGGGYPLLARGYEITFLRRGSAPGALLQLAGGAGVTGAFAPGDSVRGYFESGDILLKLAPSSASFGKALLRIALQPQGRFGETPASIPPNPVDLLGNSVTDSWVTVAEDTDPDGAAPVGSFDCSGWTKLRLLIDTQTAGDKATSFDLVPWSAPTISNQQARWFEQGLERISVPDTDTTKGRYRVVVVAVSGRGRMYFSIRNLLEAARTGLAFIIQGIE